MCGHNVYLISGAILSLSAAIIHFACIPWGVNGYKFLGAGEPIVSMSATGHWYPSFIAFLIGSILTIWGAYALSGADILPPLPFLRWVLVGISAVYLLRAVAFHLLKPIFPGNSNKFWLVTSSICFLIGLIHLVGLIQVWECT